MKSKVIVETGKHYNKEVVFLSFPKDAQLIAAIKAIRGAKWSQTEKKWYFNKIGFDLSIISAALNEKADIDSSRLKTNHKIPDEIEHHLTSFKL